jgi:hypothetical protein
LQKKICGDTYGKIAFDLSGCICRPIEKEKHYKNILEGNVVGNAFT